MFLLYVLGVLAFLLVLLLLHSFMYSHIDPSAFYRFKIIAHSPVFYFLLEHDKLKFTSIVLVFFIFPYYLSSHHSMALDEGLASDLAVQTALEEADDAMSFAKKAQTTASKAHVLSSRKNIDLAVQRVSKVIE